MASKSYLELSALPTFKERLEYLRCNTAVGDETFSSFRYLNQALYHDPEWQKIRREVIIRDNGCDLGIFGLDVNDNMIVHHINPITIDDILERRPCVLDKNNLISCSRATHNAIHYGSDLVVGELYSSLQPRTKNDTCPWKVSK